MGVPRKTVALLAALSGAAVFAAPAAALQPGVFLDPHSPAGKEYAFPLDAARGSALGHQVPVGVAPTPFGVGITRGSSVGGSGAGAVGGLPGTVSTGGHATPGLAHSKSGRSARGAGASSSGSLGQKAHESAALQSLAQPQSTGWEIALLGLPVVLGGLLVGLAIAFSARRRA